MKCYRLATIPLFLLIVVEAANPLTNTVPQQKTSKSSLPPSVPSWSSWPLTDQVPTLPRTAPSQKELPPPPLLIEPIPEPPKKLLFPPEPTPEIAALDPPNVANGKGQQSYQNIDPLSITSNGSPIVIPKKHHRRHEPKRAKTKDETKRHKNDKRPDHHKTKKKTGHHKAVKGNDHHKDKKGKKHHKDKDGKKHDKNKNGNGQHKKFNPNRPWSSSSYQSFTSWHETIHKRAHKHTYMWEPSYSVPVNDT